MGKTTSSRRGFLQAGGATVGVDQRDELLLGAQVLDGLGGSGGHDDRQGRHQRQQGDEGGASRVPEGAGHGAHSRGMDADSPW